MRILLVYAHPVETSFAAALHETALRTLRASGHEVDDLDLYAEDFDPRLGREERLAYHDPDRDLGDIAAYAERLRRAEALLFMYPTWCFGVPAILKGFFDRCFAPGVAFDIEGEVVTPKLHNIRRLGAVATYGRKWWMVKGVVGDLPRRQILRYVRWFCHPAARTFYLAHYHMNASTPASRGRFLARVERRLGKL
jgi:NAD(P)H dehydrogenase (quinone)